MRQVALAVGLLLGQVLAAEPLLLATFGNLSEEGAAGTLSSRFPWRGVGEYVWNRLALAPGALRAPDGTPSPVTVAVEGSSAALCGAAGVLQSGQFPGRVEDFPQTPVTGAWNGGVLNSNGECVVLTLSGLEAGAVYTLTLLAGRGNDWGSGEESCYTLAAANEMVACGAESAAGELARVPIAQETTAGNWMVMRFDCRADGQGQITVEGVGGSVNLNAFALEPGVMWWAEKQGGSWQEAANWHLAELSRPVPVTFGNLAAAAIAVDCRAMAVAPEAVLNRASVSGYCLSGCAQWSAALHGQDYFKRGESPLCLTSPDSTANIAVLEGRLALEGATSGAVAVSPGAEIAGGGQVGTLRLAEGAVVVFAGAPLQAALVEADQPPWLADSFPADEPYAEPAVVSLLGTDNLAQETLLLASSALSEAVHFTLPESASGSLLRRADGLWFRPAPGYHFSLH
ncbi:MAG: hypothetical protein ACI4RT_08865 [Candidatus Spyradenecus sp.]